MAEITLLLEGERTEVVQYPERCPACGSGWICPLFVRRDPSWRCGWCGRTFTVDGDG